MFTLYQFEISPFCDKVRRILNVKGQRYTIREVKISEAGRLRDEELILIGMKEAPQRPAEDDPLVRQNKARRLMSLLCRLMSL